MSIRRLSRSALTLGLIVLAATPASAAISKYIDGPRNERTVAVENGVHAWAVDTAARPGVTNVWVKADGSRAHRVTTLTSLALVGNIDLANPTYGDVLVFNSTGGRGGRFDFNVRFWDLAHERALAAPDGVNTSSANEKSPSISGNHLLFERQRASGGGRLILYRFSDQSFTSIVSTRHVRPPGFEGALAGDYLVYVACSTASKTLVCNVFRRKLSTATTVRVPNPGRINHWPSVTSNGTVYYVQGSPRICGHHAKLMTWSGTGSPRTLAVLPERVDAGPTDAYDDGSTTTLYFTRMRCAAGLPTGIYRLPDA